MYYFTFRTTFYTSTSLSHYWFINFFNNLTQWSQRTDHFCKLSNTTVLCFKVEYTGRLTSQWHAEHLLNVRQTIQFDHPPNYLAMNYMAILHTFLGFLFKNNNFSDYDFCSPTNPSYHPPVKFLLRQLSQKISF